MLHYIFIWMLLYQKDKRVKPGFLPQSNVLWGNAGALDRNVPALHPKRALPLSGERAASLSVANMGIPDYHKQATNTTSTHTSRISYQ